VNRLILIAILCLAESVFAGDRMATVDGLCYLADSEQHADTKVIFTAVSESAHTDSCLTNEQGYYMCGLSEGIYTCSFSHPGYLTQAYEYGALTFDEGEHTLDDVTLLVIGYMGEVSGYWPADDNLIVSGYAWVPTGESLMIAQGANVRFYDSGRLEVFGMLQAVGSVSDSIKFSAYNSSIEWGGIEFSDSEAHSRLEYCAIEHAFGVGGTSGGIHITGNCDSVTISNSRVSY